MLQKILMSSCPSKLALCLNHRRQDPADLSAPVPTAHSGSRGDSHLLRSPFVSSEKGARKYNLSPSNVPLPEPGIRCRDASVQLELSSPPRAYTWQELAVSATGWQGPPATTVPPVKCPVAPVALPQLSVAALPSAPLAQGSSP